MAVYLFAGIPVNDFTVALTWYERLLGSPPSFFPHETEAVWELAEHRSVFILQRPERHETAFRRERAAGSADRERRPRARAESAGPGAAVTGYLLLQDLTWWSIDVSHRRMASGHCAE
jgi:hypothetical protein